MEEKVPEQPKVEFPAAVEKWFDDYETAIADIKDVDGTKEVCMEHFKELRRSCAVVNQKMVVMEREMESIVGNMTKIADFATKCQLSASTANIYTSDFTSVKTDSGILKKALSLVMGSAHVISNWLLAIFK